MQIVSTRKMSTSSTIRIPYSKKQNRRRSFGAACKKQTEEGKILQSVYKVEMEGITKTFGGVYALKNASFRVKPGEIHALVGENGAGKSTIIKSIAGLLKYEGGIGIQRLSSKTLEAKKLFAYVPEIPAMFEALTVREHIEYIRKAYESRITDEEIKQVLDRFELWDKQDKLGNELSKGMMQKVSICCALALQPKVILFDEPMVGLDPKAIKELKEVVLELRDNNVTVLISTHMLEMVKELWDIMYVMEKGKIIGTYTKEELGEKDIDDVFFELTGGDE